MERRLRPRKQQECHKNGVNARERRLIATTPTVPVPNFLTHEQNPMMNDVILKLLFEKCSHRQLNQCRLICKQWYNVSLPLWLSNGPPIAIHDGDTMFKFMTEIHTNLAAVVDDDLQEDVQGAIIGIRRYPKFIIQPSLQWGEFDHFGSGLEGFWNQAGEWLTHLTLGKLAFNNVTSVQAALFCGYTPNLQWLEVEVECVKEELIPNFVQEALPPPEEPAKHKHLKTFRIDWKIRTRDSVELVPFPLDWRILFGHYPNLQDLAVGRYLSKDQREMNRIIQAIKEIRSEDIDKLALNSLIYFYNENHKQPRFPTPFQLPLPNSFTELLRQARLNLEAFRFDFCKEQSEDYIHTLISLHAKTLTKLEIHKPFLFERFPVRLGFNHLKRLTLTGAPVKTLLFLNTLPSLRSLSLFYSGRVVDWLDIPHRRDLFSLLSTTSVSWKSGEEFPALSEFCCNYRVGWSSNDIALLKVWFPNLTCLELALSNITLRSVCHNWPNLEHLTVYGGWVGDRGIVGYAWEEDQIVYNRPNITNLQKLRSFAIYDLDCNNGDSSEDTIISQHSVFYGFLKLPRLERLVFEVSKMGFEVKQVIRKRIPFAKIITQN